MTIVSQSHPYVIGVDTHARSHTLSIRAASGEQVAVEEFPATGPGMDRAIAWAGRRTGGQADALWVIEGIGSYGAGLARRVATAGYPVAEAPRMDPRSRRGIGKSDPLDAAAIAAAALPLDVSQLRRPRQDDGTPAALRILTTARDQMTDERTAHINELTALVRTVELGIDARHALTAAQITQIARWRARNESLVHTVARAEATRLAKRITELDITIDDNLAQLTKVVKASPAAPLLEEIGIGPVTAAVAIAAWSHPGRVRDHAAFASLAGVNPIPASSGNNQKHRLNRGGDRRLNQALHMAVINRMTHHPESRAYTERRTTNDNKTRRDVRRCLKRYLARHIHRELTKLYAQTTP